MGIRLKLGILLRRQISQIVFVPSKLFMNDARAYWITHGITSTEKRLGIKLAFKNNEQCQQCMNYLTADLNVTVANQDQQKSNELILLPHQSPEETIEEILTDLKRNDSDNFSILRRGQRRKYYKTMVEFGSPNIAKPLHMGHLRSAVTGNFVSRIYKALNHDVSNFCFLGDWGTQFGLLQAGLIRWYNGDDLLKSLNEMSLQELLEYYIRAVKEQETNEQFAEEARSYCAALEKGESTAVDIWKAVRAKTVKHLDSVWTELDIHFDVVQGESDYTMNSSHTEKAMLLLQDTEVLKVGADGRKIAYVKIGSAKEKAQVTLVKSDGSSLYILRDIAAAIHRQVDYKFDKMIYVVDKSQTNHFYALFDTLKQLGINKARDSNEEPMFQHVTFGRVEGQSTRSGTFSLLSDVIRDGTNLMEINRASSPNTRLKDDPEIAKNLAISSLIINSLKHRRNRDINFDWAEALRSGGETGVNLQYAHARLVSLIQNNSKELLTDNEEFKHKIDYEYIFHDSVALDLTLHLAK